MEHSAEWLRGAYQFASRYAPMDVAMQINVLLAAAEAREAGEREAHTVADCGWEGHDGHLPLYDPHCPHSGCPWCQGTGKIQIENTDAIKKQVASAAEVIRVAKAALEDCRGNVANHPDGHRKQFIRSEEMAEKALAAIAAWEAGNA